MARNRDLVSDYLRTLGEEPEELRFLKSVPWAIDAGYQIHSWLIKGLRLEASRLAELPRPMHFSLLTPMYNTPPRLLEELILSVRCQSWLRWELLLVDDGSRRRDHLEVARKWADRDGRIKLYELPENRGISAARNHAIEHSCGDFLAVLDHDDLLHPSTLGIYARHLNRDPEANLIFSNEAKIDEESRHVSHYTTKPPFDVFTLLRANYVCHFTAIRRDLLMAAARDGRVFRSEYDGAEDHDLFLRVALTGRARPVHVPLFLYYWRMTAESTSRSLAAKPEIPARRILLLEELLPEVYPGARWTATPPHASATHVFTSIKLRALADHPRPSLLVLVPFKDNVAETLGCLESLERQQHGLEVTVALIDNGSEGVGTLPALEDWIARPRRHRYEVLDHPGAFNFARLNNAAIERLGAGHDLLLFLNNDVELTSMDCLQAMAMQALADRGCAFVGIKLLYPGGAEVQHGGVRLTEDLYGAGYFVVDHPRGPKDFVDDERIAFGVTFACAMVRRAVYEELGGLDEVMFPNAFGDVDLCAAPWSGATATTISGRSPASTTSRSPGAASTRRPSSWPCTSGTGGPSPTGGCATSPSPRSTPGRGRPPPRRRRWRCPSRPWPSRRRRRPRSRSSCRCGTGWRTSSTWPSGWPPARSVGPCDGGSWAPGACCVVCGAVGRRRPRPAPAVNGTTYRPLFARRRGVRRP